MPAESNEQLLDSNAIKSEKEEGKRVTFNDKLSILEFKIKDEPISLSSVTQCDFSSIATFTYKIISAISHRQSGQSSMYFGMIEALKRELNDDEFLVCIGAFTSVGSQLTGNCQHLINLLIQLDWIHKKPELILAYHQFLEILVSAQPIYTSNVIEMLIKRFRFGTCTHLIIDSFGKETDAIHHKYVHPVLEGVLKLVPSGPQFILEFVISNFPHKTESLATHKNYLMSILELESYCPDIRTGIWRLIIQKLIQIDTEIQVELDDLDPDDWENRSSQVDDSDSSVDSSADDLELDFDSDDDLTITPVSLNFKDLLLKLDTMIDHLMNMVSMRLKEDHEFFQELLTIFDSLILSTHRLRCVQYLYFYIASLQDSFADDFMGLLAGKILDFSQPIVTRIAAASYLASFVARAKFIDQVSAKACIRLLNQCALKYLDSYNGGLVTRKTIVNHGIFYSMVQAIMYLFCFRWKQLIDLNASTGQLPIELASFQRVLTSKLCPFKVCSKHIIEEFARITHSYNMLYCYPFMSSDMRIPGSNEIVEKTDSEKVTTSLVLDRLESFFPFDPLHLPISKKRIAVIYQEWEDNDQDEIENLDHQLSGTSFE